MKLYSNIIKTVFFPGVITVQTCPRCLVITIALFGLAACAQSAPTQFYNMPKTATGAGKVSPKLQTAAQQLMAGESSSEIQSGLLHADSQGRLQVYVYISDFTSNNLDTLARYGLVNAIPSPALHLVEGWLYPRDLDRLAELMFVTRITPPHYAQAR